MVEEMMAEDPAGPEDDLRPAPKPAGRDATSIPSPPQAEAALGPNELRDMRVLECLPLVRRIALRISRSIPPQIELDDLIHAGVLGLIAAAARYNPDRCATFPTYAKFRIRGAILDDLRDRDQVSRSLRRWHRRFERFSHEFTAKTGRVATDTEAMEGMDVDPLQWREVAVGIRLVSLVSALPQTTQADEDGARREIPAAGDLNPDVIAVRTQLRTALVGAMTKLPPRHQTVIRMYYLAGHSMRDIAEHLHVNESRVSQIHRSALDRLAQELKALGIPSGQAVM